MISKTESKTNDDSDEEIVGVSQMDDTELFSRPQRFARVDRLVIILRGLPGSGKSSIAKNIQKLEAKFDKKTKIFTWDEYFEEVSSFRQSESQFFKKSTFDSLGH